LIELGRQFSFEDPMDPSDRFIAHLKGSATKKFVGPVSHFVVTKSVR